MKVSAATRISLGLACLTLSTQFFAQTCGLLPDQDQNILERRKVLCEGIAVQCCLAAEKNDLATIRAASSMLVSRNPDVLSAGVRKANGQVLVDIGNHVAEWKPTTDGGSTASQIQVPIFQGKKRWGTVEIRFQESELPQYVRWFASPMVRMFVFVTALGFLSYRWYLKRVLQHLDPSAVVPDRVRKTLDTLAEGVLVLDQEPRIVLANQAFARHTGKSAAELQGLRAPSIAWTGDKSQLGNDFPWAQTIREGSSQTGVMLSLESAIEGKRTMVVNTSPILGGQGECRGVLATFDDVTSIEAKNARLEEMLKCLNESRDEIHRQNEELQLLATRDPLTGCFNRRAFFTQFETSWNLAKNRGQDLSCLMLDIDFFKSINDNHGHSTGDLVLQQVATMLRTVVGDSGLVCRYGGEEFCALLPQFSLEKALELAESVRSQIAGQTMANLNITASLGASTLTLGAAEARELLEQADKSLYFSKRTGRNRVTAYSAVPADFSMETQTANKRSQLSEADAEVPIPFHAVTALISALNFRDALTAEHSRRVADLCVLTARGLMSERACYVLEVAALLHDIGKLGVPDAILLKPGPLTEDEWKVMSTHDRIGVEIIAAAFSSHELTEIVRTHHARFNGQARTPGLPTGEDIPLSARIVAVADAYDAIVSDRVYRAGRSQEAAFAELRRCSGKQFDPIVVERLIEAVTADDRSRGPEVMLPKQSALRIGVQIERLASALDSRDFANLSTMAGRLAATAQKEGVTPIAELATDLEKAAANDPELVEVVKLTTELLEMCRATQSSYLGSTSMLNEHEAVAAN